MYGVLWWQSLSSAKLLLDFEYWKLSEKLIWFKTVGIHNNNLNKKGLMNTAVMAGYPLHIPHP